MAWNKTDWSSSELSGTSKAVTVNWCWKDTVDAGIQKRGAFEFTLVGKDTWTVNMAAIQKKVDAAEGAEK